ncbi:hypothetical protein CesoFtcFv8_013345 [Champsocephalus esox]|uniref:Uncharacterized protein n=1 Tax=Champsocephalus esox TaxID=159716 RepID=A0AAN8BQM7_9TELE|nr:hypothetical protein CesoFtcFv8_013345 [Champsocephalus esox]
MDQTRCRKEESGRAPESRANMLTEDNSREHETEEMSFSPSFLCEDLSSVSKYGEGFHYVSSDDLPSVSADCQQEAPC